MTRRLIEKIRQVWGDTTNDWIQTTWLIRKQLEEIEEFKFKGQPFLNELADILIIIIRYADQIGLDYEKLVEYRLRTRHRGRVAQIKMKYSLMWEKEIKNE